MSQTKSFQIGSHTYEVTRHTGSEGLPFAIQLGALLVEPLAAAVGPLLPSLLEDAAEAGGGKEEILKRLLDNPEALASLDLGKVGVAVRQAVLSLPVSTLYGILAYTNRDGQPLVLGGRATPHFDLAYAGNYMELARALWEVARFNGFLPALDISSGGAKKAPAASPAPAGNGR